MTIHLAMGDPDLRVDDYKTKTRGQISGANDLAAQSFAEKHGVAVQLTVRRGSTGLPEYAFTGSETRLRALFHEYNEGTRQGDEQEFTEKFT